MKTILAEAKKSLVAIAALAFLCCALYPATVWTFSQTLFSFQARGSLLKRDGQVVGSSLLAQKVTAAKYFHPRPSCAGDGYDGTASGGSNLGPLSRKLIGDIGARARKYREENGLPPGYAVPADAVEASGSGLDPDISPENAMLQAPRVAVARHVPVEAIRRLVEQNTLPPALGFMGERRVNVLELNLALDQQR